MKKFGILFALIAVLALGTSAFAATTYTSADLKAIEDAPNASLALDAGDTVNIDVNVFFTKEVKFPETGTVNFGIDNGKILQFTGDVVFPGTANKAVINFTTGKTGTLYFSKPGVSLTFGNLTFVAAATFRTAASVVFAEVLGGAADGIVTVDAGAAVTLKKAAAPTTKVVFGGAGTLNVAETNTKVDFLAATKLTVDIATGKTLTLVAGTTPSIGVISGKGTLATAVATDITLNGISTFDGTITGVKGPLLPKDAKLTLTSADVTHALLLFKGGTAIGGELVLAAGKATVTGATDATNDKLKLTVNSGATLTLAANSKVASLKGAGTVAGAFKLTVEDVAFTGTLKGFDYDFYKGSFAGTASDVTGTITVGDGTAADDGYKVSLKGAFGDNAVTLATVAGGVTAHIVNEGITGKLKELNFAAAGDMYTFNVPLAVKGDVTTVGAVNVYPSVTAKAGDVVDVITAEGTFVAADIQDFTLATAELKTLWLAVEGTKKFSIKALKDVALLEAGSLNPASVEIKKAGTIVTVVTSPDTKAFKKIEIVKADFKGAAVTTYNGLTYDATVGKFTGEAVASGDMNITFKVTDAYDMTGPEKTLTLKFTEAGVTPDTIEGTFTQPAPVETGKTTTADLTWKINGNPVAMNMVSLDAVKYDVTKATVKISATGSVDITGIDAGTVAVSVVGWDMATKKASFDAKMTVTVTAPVVSADVVLEKTPTGAKIVGKKLVWELESKSEGATQVVLANTDLKGYTIYDFTLKAGTGWTAELKDGKITVTFTSKDAVTGSINVTLAKALPKTLAADDVVITVDFSKKAAGTGGSSGGGCNTAYAPFALLLAAPLFFLRKKD